MTKLLNFADKNITSVCWCPSDPSVLLQASIDKVLLIWDIETEAIKYKTQLESHVIHAEWSLSDQNIIYLI